MFLVHRFLLTTFGLMIVIFGRLYANYRCNGVTTFLNSTQNGSVSVYDNYYPDHNRSCSWLITAPIGQRVLIYFTRFKLRNCYQCDCSSVAITDGRESWSPRLARFCGKDLPGPVYSSGRYMLITFQPETYYYGNQEFQLQYLTLFHHLSSCPQITSGASAGVIYSPNFPWYYPNSKSCYWQITVPSFQNINVNFTYIYPNEDCNSYLEIRNLYSDHVIKTLWLCETLTSYSMTYSESIRVYFYPAYQKTSSFLAFYQIGYDVPSPVTTYPPTWPEPTTPVSACKPFSSVFLESSTSTSINGSAVRPGFYTLEPYRTCTWQIETTKGYTVQLMFDTMNIRSCSDCSCGYVQVRDGSGSSSQLLGTFCDTNNPSVVSSTGNHMFIKFMSRDSWDFFGATIISKEAYNQRVPAIVVPIVVGVVLFAVMITVIKCTKIRRSTVVDRRDDGNTTQTGQDHSSQVPILFEPSDDDEEMIDLFADNNAALEMSETA